VTYSSPVNILVQKLAPFIFGVTAFFALAQINERLVELSFSGFILIEVGLFFFASLLSCALVPAHPTHAATLGFLGAFTGVVLDIIIHPTVDGFERNLFPLEVAFHSIIAAPSFALGVFSWRAVITPFLHRGRNA
jgi:hypothetical protein